MCNPALQDFVLQGRRSAQWKKDIFPLQGLSAKEKASGLLCTAIMLNVCVGSGIIL